MPTGWHAEGCLESCTLHTQLHGLPWPSADTLHTQLPWPHAEALISVQGLAGQLESERARRMVAEGQVSHLEGAVGEAQRRVAALQQEVEELRRQLAQQKALLAAQKEPAGVPALQQQVEDLRRQLAQQKDLLAAQKEQAEQVSLLHWSAVSSGSCFRPAYVWRHNSSACGTARDC